MKTVKLAALAAVLALTGVTAAKAQDFQAMIASQQAAQNAYLNNMLQQNMRNPQVIAAWKTACGRGLTLEQFAYKYAATGGCSAQGYQNYNNQTNQLGAQGRAQADAYYRSLEQSRQAYNGYTQGYSNNQQEAGRVLQGNQTYYDPSTGRNVQLRYIQPGQQYTDPGTGRTYAMDGRGQYWSWSGRGWTAVNPAGR